MDTVGECCRNGRAVEFGKNVLRCIVYLCHCQKHFRYKRSLLRIYGCLYCVHKCVCNLLSFLLIQILSCLCKHGFCRRFHGFFNDWIALCNCCLNGLHHGLNLSPLFRCEFFHRLVNGFNEVFYRFINLLDVLVNSLSCTLSNTFASRFGIRL